MQTPKNLANEILNIFDRLCQANDSAVIQFQDAYKKRSSQSGFRENNRLFGVSGALIYALREAPDERYYQAIPEDPHSSVDPGFKEKFKSAILEITAEHSYVLTGLGEYIEKSGKQLSELLPALLRFYAQNEEGLPM